MDCKAPLHCGIQVASLHQVPHCGPWHDWGPAQVQADAEPQEEAKVERLNHPVRLPVVKVPSVSSRHRSKARVPRKPSSQSLLKWFMKEWWHDTGSVHQPKNLVMDAFMLTDLNHQLLQGTHLTRWLVIDGPKHPLAVVDIVVDSVGYSCTSTNMQNSTFSQHTSGALMRGRIRPCRRQKWSPREAHCVLHWKKVPFDDHDKLQLNSKTMPRLQSGSWSWWCHLVQVGTASAWPHSETIEQNQQPHRQWVRLQENQPSWRSWCPNGLCGALLTARSCSPNMSSSTCGRSFHAMTLDSVGIQRQQAHQQVPAFSDLMVQLWIRSFSKSNWQS